MVANFEIEDAETYRVYEKGFFPILKRHGGKFVTYDDATAVTADQLEHTFVVSGDEFL